MPALDRGVGEFVAPVASAPVAASEGRGWGRVGVPRRRDVDAGEMLIFLSHNCVALSVILQAESCTEGGVGVRLRENTCCSIPRT